MDKIKESFSKLLERLKGLSKGRKIAFSVLTAGIILGGVYLFIFFNTTKYEVLYGDIDPANSTVVLAKLNEKKIEYKVENNTISVPKGMAAELTMEFAPLLPSAIKGYELLEDTSAFGMTDKERSLKYKMALEGELSRRIESFPEVKSAKVLLVMQEDSNFFRPSEPSQASVTLEFNIGKSITSEQVSAIKSLLTGSVKNLPKENVKVIGIINGKTAEIGEDLENGKNDSISSEMERQQAYINKLEKEYEKKILNVLSPKYGSGVKATVAVEADFDAKEKDIITYDPNKVPISEERIKNSSNSTDGNTSSGPVDNNTSNTIPANGDNQSESLEERINYQVGQTKERIVVAPGEVKKISASVVVNNEEITDEEKSKINNSVSAAIGYSQERGDIISVEGTRFNSESDNAAAEEAARIAQEEEENRKMLMYKYIGAGAAALILLFIILGALRKSKKNKELAEGEIQSGIDIVIGEQVKPKEVFKPLDFEQENEKTHIEKEIKKYASDKPDQVAEIIKAWMTEDER